MQSQGARVERLVENQADVLDPPSPEGYTAIVRKPSRHAWGVLRNVGCLCRHRSCGAVVLTPGGVQRGSFFRVNIVDGRVLFTLLFWETA